MPIYKSIVYIYISISSYWHIAIYSYSILLPGSVQKKKYCCPVGFGNNLVRWPHLSVWSVIKLTHVHVRKIWKYACTCIHIHACNLKIRYKTHRLCDSLALSLSDTNNLAILRHVKSSYFDWKLLQCQLSYAAWLLFCSTFILETWYLYTLWY